MAIEFRKAERKRSFLRLALAGPSGSGKTFSALSIAGGICDGLGVPRHFAVVDSENGSAEKYADKFAFDTFHLEENCAPDRYVEAIKAAVDAKYTVVILDSLSHAWIGPGGALEAHDRIAARTGNSYTAWREVTPKYLSLFRAIVGSQIHIIATVRAKTGHVQEETNGKKVVRKVGMEPMLRDGSEYEFDLWGDMDLRNSLFVSKARVFGWLGKEVDKPGAETGRELALWLMEGVHAPDPEHVKSVREQIARVARELGIDECIFAVGPSAGKTVEQLEADLQTLLQRNTAHHQIRDFVALGDRYLAEAKRFSPMYGTDRLASGDLTELAQHLAEYAIEIDMSREAEPPAPRQDVDSQIDASSQDDPYSQEFAENDIEPACPEPEGMHKDQPADAGETDEWLEFSQHKLHKIRDEVVRVTGNDWAIRGIKLDGRDSRNSISRKLETAKRVLDELLQPKSPA